MDGPNLEIQKLMMSPRRNRKRLSDYFADRRGMRKETLSVLELK